jgi:serine/threonine protein phosphatase 1
MQHLFRRFEKNENGRDFVIGDLHGCLNEFNSFKQHIGFNPTIDRIFSVGDLIDRGLESEACLRLAENDWFHAVKGNHEQLFIDWFDKNDCWNDFFRNGGNWAYSLYDSELKELYSIAKSLPYLIEVITNDGIVGICHAEIPASIVDWNDLKNQIDDKVIQFETVWQRFNVKYQREPIQNAFKTIHGHTILNSVVTNFNSVYIDLGCYKTGKLGFVQIH